MPIRARFGVIRYTGGEEPPPKKWYMHRSITRYGHEDMPIWQVPLRFAFGLALLALVAFIVIQVATWWDNNTYGYQDCVTDQMADYHAQYGQAGEAFRDKVENDCFDEYNR